MYALTFKKFHITLTILFLFSLIKPSETKVKAIEKVDELLELYMGIRDADLGKIILF